jgi:hypothetical protein
VGSWWYLIVGQEVLVGDGTRGEVGGVQVVEECAQQLGLVVSE